MTIEVVLTQKQYTFAITAPAGEPFIVSAHDEEIAAISVEVQIATDPTSTLRTVGTSFTAQGFGLSEDGATTRSKRVTQGTNLARLPSEVRQALREAIRERVGVLYDPKEQLDGTQR